MRRRSGRGRGDDGDARARNPLRFRADEPPTTCDRLRPARVPRFRARRGTGLPRAGVDHDGRRPAAVPQQRDPDAHARDDARHGRRRRARHRALADRRRGREPDEQGDLASEDREGARPGPGAAQALQGRRPAHLSDPQLGSLRQPRQGGGARSACACTSRSPAPGRTTRTGSRRPASARTPARTGRSPAQFQRFAEAVGKRYSGAYRDENAIRKPLPRVSLWSLWNEPNQPGWLSPQWEKVGGVNIPVAPTLYRELHQAGVAGLEKVRPRQRTRSSSARRRRSARTSPARATPSGRSRSCRRCSAWLRTARRTRAPTRRAAAARASPRTRR